jgi:hypothetical protein
MAFSADQYTRGTTSWINHVNLYSAALRTGDCGGQGIAFLQRFFNAGEHLTERFSEELEAGIASRTEMIEATFGLAGVGDIAGTARGTLHHQRLGRHVQPPPFMLMLRLPTSPPPQVA